jgi:hypothetical protein
MNQVVTSKVLKACYSAALAFCGSLAVVLIGSEPLSGVTTGQWVVIAGTTLAAFGGTFGLAGWSGPPQRNGGTNGK